jgi:hypothetical protein
MLHASSQILLWGKGVGIKKKKKSIISMLNVGSSAIQRQKSL